MSGRVIGFGGYVGNCKALKRFSVTLHCLVARYRDAKIAGKRDATIVPRQIVPLTAG
ncbi:hypothetical protein RBWH47_03403 [Rhodopirellula baltica WH47]|uniref:Uncharacterized protein n=1 Tax=Rhodopirellula baltica WH47 TaxID=991778 RepID=F2AZF2_RHOBT|nr:hypothetical protein RBWH47_03403 [Rhodopirellula baltica WH47]